MPRILDYNGQDADRTVTVASIVTLKNSGSQLAQVTAGTAEEAAAAEAAGIEMVVCMADAVPQVRQGSSRVFVTAAIDFGGSVTVDELLGTAFTALADGADAAIRRPCGWQERNRGSRSLEAVSTSRGCGSIRGGVRAHPGERHV